MNDSISRQAAIDAINSHFGFNTEEEYGSAVQEVINGLPSAKPEQRWISCNERLPKAENYMPKRVIVSTSWKKVYVANYCVDHWEICDIDYKLSSVVAWMPLPEPYKGES